MLKGLEEERACVSLMSIDFSKAFNRMGHQACISALARMGGSTQIIYKEEDTLLNDCTIDYRSDNQEYETAIPVEYERYSLNCTPDLNMLINNNLFTNSQGTRNKKNIMRDSILEESVRIPGRSMETWTLMYIDDVNVGEKIKEINQSKQRRKDCSCTIL